MEADFSQFRSDDFSTASTALLQSILDNIPTGIEVLRAIRKDGDIIDFEYILINEVSYKRSGKRLLGKRYLKGGEEDPHFFSRMIEVTETGTTFQTIVNTTLYGAPRWFAHKYVRFEDGVIVSKEDITEKKLSEQSAIDLQHFVENIANSTPDIIYVLDLETRTFIYMNNRGYQVLGLTEEEVKRKGHDIFFQVIHPDDYVKRMDHYTQIGNDTGELVHEIDVRKKVDDGSYRWFRVRDKVYKRDSTGKATSVIGISTDIHEEKEANLALLNRERQYITLLNNTPDIILRCDKQLRLLYANASFLKLTGASLNSFLGASIRDKNIFGELSALWSPAIAKIFETGIPNEQCDMVNLNGERKFLSAQLVPEKDAQGDIITVLLIVKDVTTQQNTEDRFRQESHLLARIQETVPDMISVMNLQTREFNFLNGEIFRRHGFDPVRMKNWSPVEQFERIHGDDRVALFNYFQRLATAGDDEEINVEYRAKDDHGVVKWFFARGCVFERDINGTATHLLNVISDITERKTAEAKALQLKEEIAQKAYDRYKTLFNSIEQGFCIIEIVFDTDNKVVEYKLLEMSPSVEQQTGSMNADDHWMEELVDNPDEFWPEIYGRVALGGKSERFEYYSSRLDSWWSVFVFPVDEASANHIGVLFHDISDRKKTEELKHYLLQLSDALSPLVDAGEIKSEASRVLAEHLQADLVMYAETEVKNGEQHWSLEQTFPDVRDSNFQPSYSFADFGNLSKQVSEGKTIVANNVSEDLSIETRVKAILQQLDIGSFLSFPIIKENELVAVLVLINRRPRRWTTQQHLLVTETAQRTWSAIRQAKMQKQLLQREAELARVQQIGGVAGIDINLHQPISDTKSLRSKEYCLLHGLLPGVDWESHEDWLRRLHPDDREKAAGVLEQAIQSGASSYVSEYRIIRPVDQQIRWISAKFDIERDKDGKAIRLVGAHIDITRTKALEEATRMAEQNARVRLEEEVELRVKELKDSKELLQSVFDSTTNGLSVLEAVRDKRGKIIDFRYKYVNRTTETVNRRDDLTGALYSKIHKGYRKAGLMDMLVRVVETREVANQELYYDEEGFQNWFKVSASPLQDGVVLAFEDITERKNIELVRREVEMATLQQNVSLENFKRIIDNSHDGIVSMDPAGKIDYWNAAAENMYGFKQEEVIGKKLEELVLVNGSKTDHKRLMLEVYEHGTRIPDMETRHRNKEGATIDVVVSVFPLRNETGAVTGSCMVTKDVTEVRHSKERMREDAHLIGQIMDTTPDIVYIMDLNTYQIVYTNRQVAVEMGYTSQQVGDMKNPVLDLIHPDDLPRMMDHLKKIKTLPSDDKILEIEYRLRKPTGGYNWYCDRNSVFKRNSRNIPIEKLGFCQNITDRKQKEEQARTSLTILHQAEQVVTMGSWEYDILNDEFKWSEGMYRLFGLGKDIAIRPEIYFDYAIETEKTLVEKMVGHILQDFVSFEETITISHGPGEQKIIKVKAVVERDKDGHPVKILGVDIDVTQQLKDAQEINNLYRTLLKKNKELQVLDSEIKTFNSVSAHQYKETLQQLYTNLEYIVSKDGRALSDTSKANIRRAQSAIQKMNLLTDDINAYFRLFDEEANITEIDASQTVQNVISQFQQKLENANARVEYSDLPRIPSNTGLFAQLISNLIDNAIKFRAVTIPLTIKIKASYADELNAIPAALKDTPYFIVSVSDNGIGFNEDVAEKIFEIFYRLSENGTSRGRGMGLAVCRKIMSLHEGFITADGAVGRGATFNCYFPAKSKLR